MEQATSRWRREHWLVPIAVIVPMLAAIIWYGLGRADAADTPRLAPRQTNAVYLSDPDKPVLDHDLARAWGVRSVATVPELLMEAATAEVVAIEGTSFVSGPVLTKRRFVPG